eukprot:941735-Prymnesium_polylepis.2
MSSLGRPQRGFSYRNRKKGTLTLTNYGRNANRPPAIGGNYLRGLVRYYAPQARIEESHMGHGTNAPGQTGRVLPVEKGLRNFVKGLPAHGVHVHQRGNLPFLQDSHRARRSPFAPSMNNTKSTTYIITNLKENQTKQLKAAFDLHFSHMTKNNRRLVKNTNSTNKYASFSFR